MVDDPRESREAVSDTHVIGSGSSSTVDGLDVADGKKLVLEYLKVEYADAGTTTSVLEVHDNEEGTASGNLDNRQEHVELQSGDRITLDSAVWSDFEDGVILNPDGNQDDDILVTLGGYYVAG